MSCKLGDKCDNVFACNILRPNVELLGCNFYKPKKPITNEEWLRSCTTMELAEWIVGMSTICTINHECDRCDSWCDEKKVVKWLKEKHTE